MAAHQIIQIVASQSSPEKEKVYNKWYTEVHVPMLFGYKGLKQASRYKLIGDNKNVSRYLAIYEFDDAESMAAFSESKEFAEAVKDFENRKEAVGFDMKWAASYELIKTYNR
jgi:hypothetical protein